MKREGYLFEKLVSYDNIKEAFFNAAKNKKYKKKINRIQDNLDFYISEIQKRGNYINRIKMSSLKRIALNNFSLPVKAR